jgi:hypothetical protein
MTSNQKKPEAIANIESELTKVCNYNGVYLEACCAIKEMFSELNAGLYNKLKCDSLVGSYIRSGDVFLMLKGGVSMYLMVQKYLTNPEQHRDLFVGGDNDCGFIINPNLDEVVHDQLRFRIGEYIWNMRKFIIDQLEAHAFRMEYLRHISIDGQRVCARMISKRSYTVVGESGVASEGNRGKSFVEDNREKSFVEGNREKSFMGGSVIITDYFTNDGNDELTNDGNDALTNDGNDGLTTDAQDGLLEHMTLYGKTWNEAVADWEEREVRDPDEDELSLEDDDLLDGAMYGRNWMEALGDREDNREKSFVEGNRGKSFVEGNRGKSFMGGNRGKSFVGGNREKSFMGGSVIITDYFTNDENDALTNDGNDELTNDGNDELTSESHEGIRVDFHDEPSHVYMVRNLAIDFDGNQFDLYRFKIPFEVEGARLFSELNAVLSAELLDISVARHGDKHLKEIWEMYKNGRMEEIIPL